MKINELPSKHNNPFIERIYLSFFSKKIHRLTRTINIIALVIIMLEIVINILYLISVNLSDPHRPITVLWFNYLQFFTYQSNIFIIFMLIQYFSQLHIKERKYWTNSYMLYTMTYICITFITYAAFLSWQHDEFGIIHTRDGKIDYVWYIQNIFLHFVCPMLCILWFILSCFAPSYFHYQMYSQKLWKFILLGLIYPIIYIIYADLLSTISYYVDIVGNHAPSKEQHVVYPLITVFVGRNADVLLSSLFPICGLIIFVVVLFIFWILDRRILDRKRVNHDPITLMKGSQK